MKKTFLFLAFACVAMLFSSCHKEGVFNPKKKISKIYTSNSYTINGNTTTFNKTLEEEWTWNKNNTLSKIDVHGSLSETTETYTYDKKRVSRIDGVTTHTTGINGGGTSSYHIEFKYNGKELSEASYYDGNELQTKLKFTHQNGKISKIELFEMDLENMDKNIKAIHSILPEHLYSNLEKMYKKRLSKSNTKGDATIIYELTWDKNNISKAVCTAQWIEGYEKDIMEYKYDNYNNPFYGFLSPEMGEYSGADYFSKNNITQITTHYQSSYSEYENSTDINNYTYTYDGKYPVSCTQTVNYDEGSYTTTTEYEYK
ncbi:MAG: hypothetical protein J6P65_06290 [Bacteroidales bacterium]|nr:hypothetical protein [Bacteroidales bacterium]